jgi:aconitase B
MAAGKIRTAIFEEDRWIAEVEILENTSDAEYSRYKLKVIKTIQRPVIFSEPPDGTEFSVIQQKNAGAWKGMWSLKRIQERSVSMGFREAFDRLLAYLFAAKK